MFKLGRASEDLQTLQAEVIEFFAYEPDRVTTKLDQDRTRYVVDFAGDLPARWGPLIGNVLHNLRASLDYIAQACARQLADVPNRYVSWPVCSRPEDWGAQSGTLRPNKTSPGVSPEAQELIGEMQPYKKSRGEVELDPLWILNELGRIDRHQALHVAVMETAGTAIMFSALEQRGNVVIDRPYIARFTTRPVEPDPQVAPLAVVTDEEGREARTYVQPCFNVFFQPQGDIPRRLPVLETLEGIEVTIRGHVLPPFWELLESPSTEKG